MNSPVTWASRIEIPSGRPVVIPKDPNHAWVQLPNSNPMFGGQAPLASMITGGVPAMIRVRQLVDARRGGL